MSPAMTLPKSRLPAHGSASSNASASASSNAAAAPRAEAPVEAVSDSTCRSWLSQNQPERAVECFESVARGTGVGAQVALYEAARVSADGLHDATRALSLLDQHQQRFPDSALRVEVEWLRIRNLERSGNLADALTASEALLDSAAGRALAPKLHLLRGRIYSEGRHDCAHAVREYVALLGEPGSAADEAEFRRAQCLEELQQPNEAREAYEHYLGRPQPRDAERARARLTALPAATPPTKDQP